MSISTRLTAAPSVLQTFKPTTDPDFAATVLDCCYFVVLTLLEQAIVPPTDDGSQIQALDRNQLILPMRPRQAARRSL